MYISYPSKNSFVYMPGDAKPYYPYQGSHINYTPDWVIKVERRLNGKK